MLHYPCLTDGVVSLREWSLDDVAEVHRMVQDPEISRYTSVPVNYTIEGLREWIAARDAEMQAGRNVSLAIREAHDDRILGSVGLELSCADPEIGEIGYWVSAEARRQGVARAAVHLVAEWAFHTLGLARLEITVHEDNIASHKVALANGFKREGTLRAYRLQHGVRVDLVMYSKLRRESTA